MRVRACGCCTARAFRRRFLFFLAISEKFCFFVFMSRSVDFMVVVDYPVSSVRPDSAVLVLQASSRLVCRAVPRSEAQSAREREGALPRSILAASRF